MNSRTLIAIVVVALVALGAYFLLTNRAAAPTPPPTPDTTTTQEPTTSTDTETIITYTDGGFSPENATIALGDTLRFVNNSGSGMWVGADDHPTHTSYDGTATREHCEDGVGMNNVFDMCRQIAPGESWTYTFTKTGTFEYHNHAQSSHGGSVTVSE